MYDPQLVPTIFQIEASPLSDSDARIAKEKCLETFLHNAHMILHYVQCFIERGLSPEEMVIVVMSASDVHGAAMLNMIQPGRNYIEEARRCGEQACDSVIMDREDIEILVEKFDRAAVDKLCIAESIAILIIDHGVAEVFSTDDFGPHFI